MIRTFIAITILFVSLAAFAKPPPQWVTWPFNGTVYLDKSLCPEPCHSMLDHEGELVDLEIVEPGSVEVDDKSKPIVDEDGKIVGYEKMQFTGLVVKASKKAARDVAKAASEAAVKAKKDRIAQAKEFAKGYKGKTFKNLAEATNAFEHLLVVLEIVE